MEYTLILEFLNPEFLPPMSIKILEKILPLFTNIILLGRQEEVSSYIEKNQTKVLLRCKENQSENGT